MMTQNRLRILLLVLMAFLVACGAQDAIETVIQEVEVTRVVTETVVEEGEVVEVTRVVTQIEVVEVTRELLVESEATAAPETAAGSEVLVGAAPPAPGDGAKVEEPRSGSTPSTGADETSELAIESRSEGESAEVAPVNEVTVERLALPLDQNSRLTAGEVDDNVAWDDYLLYLRDYEGAAVIEVDVSERHQIWVRDNRENPLLGAQVDLLANGQTVTTLRTHSDGRVYFFPRAYNIEAEEYTVNVQFNGVTESIVIPAGSLQREWFVAHSGGDQATFTAKLDLLFLLDATGSMADEINQLKDNIQAISAQIDALPAQPDVRFGLVIYRDRGDAYVTQTFDFTPDVAEFTEILAQVEADGGGDYPEDLNEALSQAIHNVGWRVDGTVSLIFLVADAPPHLDYEQENHYAFEMLGTAQRGIKIYPIASSGLDGQGEYVFRQLAQFTGGRFIFLTYGAEGPGSTGTETDLNVSDYTVSSLDQLVVRIVQEELAYLVR
jgi:hypothetical protein